MIPVFQHMTVANDGEGNCFNACVASILELPLREVAAIYPKTPAYWDAWEDWFAERGLFLNIRGARKGPPKGYAIAAGRSSRLYPEGHRKAGQRIHHAVVVFDGEVVHDPFPIKGEFGEIGNYWTIDPITDGQLAYIQERKEATCASSSIAA